MEVPPFFKRISPNKTSAGMSITGAGGWISWLSNWNLRRSLAPGKNE